VRPAVRFRSQATARTTNNKFACSLALDGFGPHGLPHPRHRLCACCSYKSGAAPPELYAGSVRGNRAFSRSFQPRNLV
jgi:hypothetical protein